MSDDQRRFLPRWTWTEMAGAGLGAVGVFADWVGSDFHWSEHSTIVEIGYFLLAVVGNAGGVWVLLAILTAYLSNRLGGSIARSMATGAVFLGVAVIVYYGLNVIVGMRVWDTPVIRALLIWLTAALVMGAAAGVIAWWLRSPDTMKRLVATGAVFAAVAFDVIPLARSYRIGEQYGIAVYTVLAIYVASVAITARVALRDRASAS